MKQILLTVLFCLTALAAEGQTDSLLNAITDTLESSPILSSSDSSESDYSVYYDFEDSYSNDSTYESEVKKRLDFTHVVKSQPKAPRRFAPEKTGSDVPRGYYTNSRLHLDLSALADGYAVRLTSLDGESVYQEELHSSQTPALEIALSGYATGDYLVTIENAGGYFQAQFDVLSVSAVRDIRNAASSSVLFDLCGRRMNRRPSKGIYIENGRKRVAK